LIERIHDDVPIEAARSFGESAGGGSTFGPKDRYP
jgi:hypothetical protein